MIQTISQLITPMFSLVAVVLGSGLLSTLIPLRLQIDGYSEITIGIVSAAFYAGLMLGAFKIEPIVSRIGHIRSYAAFASLLAISSLLQGLSQGAEIWFALRLVTGYCMAGIFIIIESWFLASGPVRIRGRLLALYMTAMYASQSGSQFLLYLGDIQSLELFCVITIFTCISIVPLSLTRLKSPTVHEPSALGLRVLYKISPSGMMGSFTSGLLLGSLYSLFPIFVVKIGYGIDEIAKVMGLLILGGMILQYPMGRLSDHFDRRKMLIVLCLLIGSVSILIIVFSYFLLKAFFISCIIYGGLAFMLYPLSISHTCDHVQQKDIVGATQGLLLVYGIGAMIGPILSGLFMSIHHTGLMIFIAIFTALLALFIHLRGNKHPPLPLEEQHDFAISSTTTPVASNMDSRANEEKDDKKT